MPRGPTYATDAREPELRLTWRVPVSEDLRALIIARGELTGASTEDLSLYFLGPVLVDDRLVSLGCGVHPSGIVFVLQVQQRPKADPPPDFSVQQDKVGGAPGLFEVLQASAKAAPVSSADARMTLKVDAKAWRCPWLPRPVLPADPYAQLLNVGSAQVEQMGFRVPNGGGGIEEISLNYEQVREQYALVIRQRCVLKIEASLRVLAVEDACDLVLAQLFSEKEPADVPPK